MQSMNSALVEVCTDPATGYRGLFATRSIGRGTTLIRKQEALLTVAYDTNAPLPAGIETMFTVESGLPALATLQRATGLGLCVNGVPLSANHANVAPKISSTAPSTVRRVTFLAGDPKFGPLKNAWVTWTGEDVETRMNLKDPDPTRDFIAFLKCLEASEPKIRLVVVMAETIAELVETFATASLTIAKCVLNLTVPAIDSVRMNPMALFFLADAIVTNMFAVPTDDVYLVYETPSLINHSCDPNSFKGKSPGVPLRTADVNIIALRDIEDGEEVTMSYYDVCGPDANEGTGMFVRHNKALVERFQCACPACTAPVEGVTDFDAWRQATSVNVRAFVTLRLVASHTPPPLSDLAVSALVKCATEAFKCGRFRGLLASTHVCLSSIMGMSADRAAVGEGVTLDSDTMLELRKLVAFMEEGFDDHARYVISGGRRSSPPTSRALPSE